MVFRNVKMALFWVLPLCSLVEVLRRFRINGATTQKTASHFHTRSREKLKSVLGDAFLRSVCNMSIGIKCFCLYTVRDVSEVVLLLSSEDFTDFELLLFSIYGCVRNDISVDKLTRLEDLDSIPGRELFSLRRQVQTGPGDHSASYPVGTGFCSSGVKQLRCECSHSSPTSVDLSNA
jgi:hypothetical protein